MLGVRHCADALNDLSDKTAMTDSALHSGETLPSCEIRITQELIDAYAAISGDYNPIHVDLEAAAASPFGGTIAHGCIPLEPVFQAVQRWLGRPTLPPHAAINLRYRAPSRPGDVIRAEAQVTGEKADGDRHAAVIAFVCLNQRDERVIEGECLCDFPHHDEVHP